MNNIKKDLILFNNIKSAFFAISLISWLIYFCCQVFLYFKSLQDEQVITLAYVLVLY